MVRQELFVGSNYANGLFGKKVLVVGHQKHATKEEIEKYRNNSTLEYTYNKDNVEMLKQLCNGTCMKWEPYDRKSWLQFGKMLSGNRAFMLGTKESSDLWESIAFCNYLQIPDFNLEARQGKDKESLYVYSKKVFNEYLEEIEPDRIIVWGKYAYPYVSELGEKIDDRHCIITLPSGKSAYAFKINHPSRIGRGGYELVIHQIDSFLKQ